MVAATVLANPNGIDKSYGHTDQKEYQNLLAITGNGVASRKQVYQATVDPASLADAAGATIQLTGCTGVILGKTAVTGIVNPLDIVDFTVTGYVQADGVIELRFQNESAAGVNIASGVWKVITETLDI